ncbi:MAG: hypothetical protein ACOH13_10285 [Flavobacteriales bacterium]
MSNATVEDKREAVLLGANLSNQLITTALALIAVVGAASTYIMDKREVNALFYVLLSLAFALQVLSIYFGGRGINKARSKGSDGDWDKGHTKDWYNRQATATLAGAVVLCALFFLGKEKPSEDKGQLKELSKVIADQTTAMQGIVEKMSMIHIEEMDRSQQAILQYEDSVKVLRAELEAAMHKKGISKK